MGPLNLPVKPLPAPPFVYCGGGEAIALFAPCWLHCTAITIQHGDNKGRGIGHWKGRKRQYNAMEVSESEIEWTRNCGAGVTIPSQRPPETARDTNEKRKGEGGRGKGRVVGNFSHFTSNCALAASEPG